jgi:parallel beta-helix repeat protein
MFRYLFLIFSLLIFSFLSCGKKEKEEECTGPCVTVSPGKTPQETTEILKSKIDSLKEGDILYLRAGKYEVLSTLYIEGNRITIRGAGPDRTILSFAGMITGTGADGLHLKGKNLTVESLSVLDPRGDGIKIEECDGLTIRKVKAGWSGGPKTENGGYGIYPVRCKNVLIENSEAFGASDTGIYIGQSERIIIRRNRAHHNVAGIEVENSRYADVYENESYNNTGGILVFDLPYLEKKGGGWIRVFNNRFYNNNLTNFAPEGNIVGLVPRGSGMIVMANRKVEIFQNSFENHGTVHIAIISYFVTLNPDPTTRDTAYYPYPQTIFIHNNRFGEGGKDPDTSKLIGLGLAGVFPNGIPYILYDGIRDPQVGTGLNPAEICIQESGVTFADLHLDPAHILDSLGKNTSTDITPFLCTLEPLPPVTF